MVLRSCFACRWSGQLVSRVDPRALITFGFICTALALLHMTTIYPGIDFHTAVLYRIYQSVGLAFLFVPINTISFVGVKPSQGNQVSAMINLFRNLGGSIGISAVATLISRRSQVHQNYLAAHTSNYDTGLISSLAGAKAALFHAGSSLPDAALQANGRIYGALQQQATALAYVDTIRVFAICAVCAMPLVFLARRPSRGAAPAAAH